MSRILELVPESTEEPCEPEVTILDSLGSEDAIDEYLKGLATKEPVAIKSETICIQPEGWDILKEIDHRECTVSGFYVGLRLIMVAKRSKQQLGAVDSEARPELVAVFHTVHGLDIPGEFGEKMIHNDIGDAGRFRYVAVRLDQEVSFGSLEDNLSKFLE